MQNRIRIGRPRIVEGIGGTRLEADICWEVDGAESRERIFYEVEGKWGRYLTPENSNAFILPLFTAAMEKGCDIEYEVPMSADLKYHMEQYLIPIYSKKIKVFSAIRLNGPVTDVSLKSENAVGTGFSAGVDSFYTVLSHRDIPYKTKRVTHLLLAVNGAAATGLTEECDRKWFAEEMGRFTPLAEEMGLELIGVNSNVSLINRYRTIQKGGDVITTMGFVYALNKLFGTYLWASADEAKEVGFDDADGRLTASYTVEMLGSEGLRVYLSGTEVNRMEKVEYIADFPVVQKGLTVCGSPSSCGMCNKCLRTMTELYALGKLDKFGAVFDVKKYMEHLSTMMARELALDHEPYTTEIRDYMRRTGQKIPISVWLKKNLWFKEYYFLKSANKKSSRNL